MVVEKTFEKDGVKSVAVFSDCEKYRYSLTRVWDADLPRIMFVGLNPSTADEIKNDPTVNRSINFAKSWGFGSMTMMNLFAFRATFPKDLKVAEDPIGKDAEVWIIKEAEKCEKIVAAWGNHGSFLNRSENVLAKLKDLYCFGLTKQGQPKHPLYLRLDSKIQPLNHEKFGPESQRK